jgi:hypothetical protein
MGLFSYKKVVHPVRTAERAVKRSATPKSLRGARRAATSAAHPVSSVEGATKAAVSRSVKGGHSQNSHGLAWYFGWGLAYFLVVAGPPWWAWTQHTWWGYVLAIVLGIVWTIPVAVFTVFVVVDKLRDA